MIDNLQILSEFYHHIRGMEYDFLVWLSHYRTPFLNILFLFATLMGSRYFYICLIPMLFIFFDKKRAYSFSVLILVSVLINTIIKEIFAIPRPLDDIVHPLYTSLAKGFSFPSGHAQGSMTLWGLIIILNRKSVKIIITSIFMILLISFSRLYLGVHFPTDILSGWVVGVVVLFCYRFFQATNLSLSRSALVTTFATLSILFTDAHIRMISLIIIGICLGKSKKITNGLSDRKAVFCVLLSTISVLIFFKLIPSYTVLPFTGIGLHLIPSTKKI